jgi:hypothetical protein
MRKLLKRIGTGLLFVIIALCLAPTLVPPFLDRIYYRGPVSDHFDGERFFNPGFRGDNHGGPANLRGALVLRGQGGMAEAVAVHARQAGQPGSGEMVATWIGHSTVLVQAGGLNILTDPIWSERASPFQWIGPQRARAPGIRFEDLPRIDLVPDQPQSLRSHGPADAQAAVGARPAVGS